jgi:hypothetical protein
MTRPGRCAGDQQFTALQKTAKSLSMLHAAAVARIAAT